MAGMSTVEGLTRVSEARYAYYRRCQVRRNNGEQCKAPAEKGSQICYAHASQRAMALRREQERQAVLAEAVAEIRRAGSPGFEMADLFMDLKSIQVTLAVTARALMNGRIDCKTAGRLLVDLQTVSKLLRIHTRKTKTLPLINTDDTDLRGHSTEKPNLSTEARRHPFHQDSTGAVRDHEDTPESRSNMATESAGNTASGDKTETTNAKIVEIRSAEQAPSASYIFCRHDSRATLLTG